MAGKTASWTLSRIALAIGTFLTFVGFIIFVVALSWIQWKLNDMDIPGNFATFPNQTQPLVEAYTATLTSANYISYPLNPTAQFGLAWFTGFGELPVWILTLWLLIKPEYVHSARLAVVAWVASFQVVVWYHINTLLYLSRSPVAKQAFSSTRINLAVAGAFFVGIGNAIVVTSLSLWRRHDGDTSAPQLKHNVDKHATKADINDKASNSSSDHVGAAV